MKPIECLFALNCRSPVSLPPLPGRHATVSNRHKIGAVTTDSRGLQGNSSPRHSIMRGSSKHGAQPAPDPAQAATADHAVGVTPGRSSKQSPELSSALVGAIAGGIAGDYQGQGQQYSLAFGSR